MEFLRQLERILLPSGTKNAVIYAKDYMISVDDSFATVIFKDKSIIVPRDLTDRKITDIDLRHIGSISLPITRTAAAPVVTEVISPLTTTRAVVDGAASTRTIDAAKAHAHISATEIIEDDETVSEYLVEKKDILVKFNKILEKCDVIKKYIFWKRYENYFEKVNTDLKITVSSGDILPPLFSKVIGAELTDKFYEWKSGEVFIGFANHIFGGGILDKGWEQEEQLVSCLELFINILELQAKYKELDKYPCIISTKAFAYPKREYYGKKGLEKIITENAKEDDVEYISPVDIYWVPIAAVDFRKDDDIARELTEQDIKNMILTACRAFTIISRHVKSTNKIIINTGKWGSGVFRWKDETSYLIQCVSFSTVFGETEARLCFSTAGDTDFKKYNDVIVKFNRRYREMTNPTLDNVAEAIYILNSYTTER